MQAAPPSMEERSKRMQGQLDAMRQFLVQSKAEPAVLASFDASAEAYKQQAARMMQRFAQGATSGAAASASGGAAPQGMTGGGNGARRFADRFAKAFESVRAQLSPELQRQWDQQIQALFNAKRATVYVLEKGEPVAVEIRLGVSDGSRSEVIGGLKSGQQVIVGSARSTP
jgi:HlyD family secretion protein